MLPSLDCIPSAGIFYPCYPLFRGPSTVGTFPRPESTEHKESRHELIRFTKPLAPRPHAQRSSVGERAGTPPSERLPNPHPVQPGNRPPRL